MSETSFVAELLRPIRSRLAYLEGVIKSLASSTLAGGSNNQVQINASGVLGGITNGATGTVLTSTGTGSAPTFQVSGSGNATTSTAVGSEPGSPTTGDLDLYTNGFSLARYSGTAWPTWGPIFAFTNPSLGAPTTWVNQGSASVTTTNGGVFLLGPKGSTTNARCRVKTAPATPYVITIAMLPALISGNFQDAGLLFRDSASGKMAVFAIESSSGAIYFNSAKYNSATSVNSSYASPFYFLTTSVMWLRIADNGTNRICSYSVDGQNFIQIHSIGRTDFLTADQVGYYVNDQTNTYDVGMTLLSWKET